MGRWGLALGGIVAVAAALLPRWGVVLGVVTVAAGAALAWRWADRGRGPGPAEAPLHDELTGLVTEAVFVDRLERALAAGSRTERGVAVAFLDLDGFRRVTATAGPGAGEEVLRTVAARLGDTVRHEDTVARRSADEFLVLLPGVDRAEDAETVAHKLTQAVGERIEVGAGTVHVGASIGLALWPRDAATAEELVHLANAAMLDAKGATGDRVRWSSAASSARGRITSQLRSELETEIARDRLRLAIQPAVDLLAGEVARLHALVRWHHPQLGVLTPRVFLPLLVDPAVARALDVAVLDRAVASARRWHELGWIAAPIVVTLSAATATWTGLPSAVARTLDTTGLRPERLVLAVDEGTVRTAGARLATVTAELADIGTGLLVTHVGAGPLDLRHLAALPLSGLEVAPTLVGGHAADGNRAVLGTVAALASSLGVPASASGVIGPSASEVVRAAGYTVGRGSYLGPPRDVPDLETALAASAEDGHDPASVRGAVLGSGGAPPLLDAGLAHVLSAVLQPDGQAADDEVEALLERLAVPAHTTDDHSSP